MQWPSFSLILSAVFLLYITHSLYTLSLLFVSPPCETGKPCLTSYLSTKPLLHLHMFYSIASNPFEADTIHANTSLRFNYLHEQNIPITIELPRKTRQNGTLFLHIILVPESSRNVRSFSALQKEKAMVYTKVKLTQYAVPYATTFNLLKQKHSQEKYVHPVTHIKKRVTFTIMTDDIVLPMHNLPLELIADMRITRDGTFLPIVNYDFLKTRHSDLVEVTLHSHIMNITVSYTPISLGKLRLMLHIEAAMQGLKNLGFSDKDIDEVKGIFADTNIYLLGGTIFIAAVHLLFDFLAFKNDISFWRGKSNLAGLSTRTVVWRAFSQIVIFLYLLDEGSSLLILVPVAIGTIIEVWKLKKIFRAEIIKGDGLFPKIKFNNSESSSTEIKTCEFDAESMKYLSYLLYPLVVAGAIYSLLYQPHKSWHSWCINSLVNGVYAFGFLFMLPQLFVNYKLKSVAHLPWRAFMYKAFNTFIDDLFAFIITMPTAHRVACFRDDAVFLIYLYQRWLYPVDNTRLDNAVSISEGSSETYESVKKQN